MAHELTNKPFVRLLIRCQREPLCTTFEAVPPAAASAFKFCQLWKLCGRGNTHPTTVSSPILINAYILQGECLIDRLKSLQNSNALPGAHGISMPQLLTGVASNDSRIGRTAEVTLEGIANDPRVAAIIHDMVDACWPDKIKKKSQYWLAFISIFICSLFGRYLEMRF